MDAIWDIMAITARKHVLEDAKEENAIERADNAMWNV